MEEEAKNPELWKLAQKRAGFKYHLLIYFIMNIFFWMIWYISLKIIQLRLRKEMQFPGRSGQCLVGESAYFLITSPHTKTPVQWQKKNIKN